MGTFFEKNKIFIGIIIVGFIIGGFIYLSKQPISDISNLIPTSEGIKSFEELDKVEEWEKLKDYGLLPPDTYNHKSGKNLIMLALKPTSFFKGDWVAAHGLLGVSMLDTRVIERIAYRSLFRSILSYQSFKMYSNYKGDNGLLMSIDKGIIDSKSIIAKRESVITVAAWELNSRYIYDNQGNFGRNYYPDPTRKDNENLKKIFIEGIKVYEELKEMGYDDKTLKDCLGMVYASLDFDGVYLEDAYKLYPLQVYSDTLNATLAKLRKNKEHSYDVLEEIGWEMEARGLAAQDKILLPDDDSNFQEILKIVEGDLSHIEGLKD